MIILPSDARVLEAFKWMFSPIDDIILVARGATQYHIDCLKQYQNLNLTEFDNWIRFIHLDLSDFKFNAKNKILCVRKYKKELLLKSKVKELVQNLGIKSKIVFDIDNEKLGTITKDYFRKW